jgi:toxin secretion/phage lysis holin
MRLLVSAVVGANGKEFLFGSMTAFVAYVASNFLGGWDKALQVLLFLMVADYVSGVVGAIKNHNVNSEVMFWGGVRKAVILMVIAIAFMCDQIVGNNSPVFRTIALFLCRP